MQMGSVCDLLCGSRSLCEGCLVFVGSYRDGEGLVSMLPPSGSLGVCFSLALTLGGSLRWVDVASPVRLPSLGWSSPFPLNAGLQQLQGANLQVGTSRQGASQFWYFLSAQSCCCPFIFGPIASFLLCQHSDAFKNKFLCFILTFRCCCQECSSVCFVGRTVRGRAVTTGAAGCAPVVRRWFLLVFVLFVALFSCQSF